MKFTPRSETELAEANCFPKGIYPFEILEAEERVSKKGSDMIYVKLNVFGPNDRSRWVKDYLLEAIPHKLRHFCQEVGLLAKYEAGELDADMLIGKQGRVALGIEVQEGFPAKNNVVDYGDKSRPVEAVAAGAPPDDTSDIPF